MDAVRLPVGRLAAAMLAGQRRGATAGGGDDGIVPGRTIIVTSTTDSVDISINGVKKTYAVTPDVPSRIVIEEDRITSLEEMFYGNKNIVYVDFSELDTSNVTSMYRVLRDCSSLTGLNMVDIDVSKCGTFYGAFWRLPVSSLDLSHWELAPKTDMSYIFTNATFKTLDISSFDFGRVTGTTNIFAGCVNLTNLKFGYNNTRSINFSSCPLTHESALSVIEGLAEVDTAQTVTFKATTYGTLTEGEIALATSRGWSVVSA